MTVFVADEHSVERGSVDLDRLRRLAAYVAREQGVPEAMELSVLCVDPDVMAQLNAQHMDGEGPTDVLAFPIDLPGETLGGEPAILGDVVLCPAVAAAQAREHGHSLDVELDLLLVHGILHLLGHDHATPEERALMFGRTDELLRGFTEAER